MRHKIWYDDANDVLREKLIGSFTKDDVEPYLALMEEVYGRCNHIHVIVDLSEAEEPFFDGPTRELLAPGSGKLRYFDERVAFIKARPEIRELAIELVDHMRHLGKSLYIQFFDTDEEALAWLKG